MQQIDEFEDKKTHGKKIKLTEHVIVDGKRKKKKKGIFYEDFVTTWSGAVASLEQDEVVEAEIVVEEVEMEKKKRRLDDNEEVDYKRKYLELLSRLNETKGEGTLKKIKGDSIAKIKKNQRKQKQV